MKTIYSFFLSLLILLFASCNDVENCAEQIADRNVLESEFVGFFGMESNQYKRYKLLERKATKKELLEMVEGNSSALTCYSLFILMDRKLVNPIKFFKRFLSDDKNVSTFSGCVGSSSTISSEIYFHYRNSLIKSDASKSNIEQEINLNDPNLVKLDSMILFSSEANEFLRMIALEERKYPKSYIPRIKHLAFKNEDFYSVKYLFRHSKDEDKAQIKTILFSILDKKDLPEFQKKEIQQMLAELRN